MATFKFQFTIPNSIYRFRWKNIKNYLSWLFKPDRCYVCNSKLPVSRGHFEYFFNDSPDGHSGRMLMSWDVERQDDKPNVHICRHCLAESISDRNAVPKMGYRNYGKFEIKNKCDCCGKKKKSYKWTAFKLPGNRSAALIMGNYCSWNSAHYCSDCIKTSLKSDVKMITSFWGSYKGKHAPIQQNGLPVVDGKPRFPDR